MVGRTAVMVAAGFISAGAVAQGDSGFLRGKGKLDVALSYGLDTYDEFWVGGDKISGAPFGRVTRHNVNVYAAYGLTDSIDLALNGSYVYASSEEIFEDEHGLQDLTTQLKWRFFSKKLGPGTLNLLAAPALQVPMSHYEDNAVTAIGDGSVDLGLRGIAQYVFDNGIFFALETGYDVRFDAAPDEYPLHLTAGATVFGKLTVTGFYSLIDSLGGYDIGQGPFPGVEEQYHRAGGVIYYRINETVGISGSAWTTFDGKNTGDVDGFSLGVVLKF